MPEIGWNQPSSAADGDPSATPLNSNSSGTKEASVGSSSSEIRTSSRPRSASVTAVAVPPRLVSRHTCSDLFEKTKQGEVKAAAPGSEVQLPPSVAERCRALGRRMRRRSEADASAVAVPVKEGASMSEGDVDWLETMLPGLQSQGGKLSEYTEDSYLTELIEFEQMKWLILPMSNLRTAWDMLTLGLVLYTAVTVPYVIAFLGPNESVPIWMTPIDLAGDAIFMIDILINFSTAYVRTIDATLVVDRVSIRKNYLTGWFPIDMAGSIPFELISLCAQASGSSLFGGGGGGADTGSVQIIKILKVPKLLRLGRLFKFLTRFEGAANFGRIVLLIMLLCMLIHWLAALFFLIAARPGGWIDIHICQQRTDELAQHSFFVPVRHPDGVGLGAFECVPQGDSDAAFGIYILTYYYVLLMLMGDDVGPTNQYETLYMVFVILVGSCVNATIFANVASLTAQMTADAVAHQAKMDGIDRTMRQLHSTRPRRSASEATSTTAGCATATTPARTS